MYQEDLPFGTSYAIGNIKRQRDILKEHLKDYFYLGLTHEETYIGHLNAHIQGTRAKIDEFYVIDQYQKQGYGSAMMSFMLKHLENKGVDEVYLVTDLADTAQSLYVKYGFKLMGTFKEYQKSFDITK
jgi:ribosomal protein S18 acetylase RimI-like enzyme